jgi:hypothetical protein
MNAICDFQMKRHSKVSLEFNLQITNAFNGKVIQDFFLFTSLQRAPQWE